MSNKWKPLIIENELKATSLSSASIVTFGGLAVKQNLLVGESIRTFKDFQCDGSLKIGSNVESTSPMTGGLIVQGGFGLTGSLHMTGVLSVKQSSHLGDLSVYGRTVFTREDAGDEPDNASVVIKGSSNLFGKVFMRSDLLSEGSASFLGSLSLRGGLAVNGPVCFVKTLQVQGSLDVQGELSIKNRFTALEMYVFGKVSVSGFSTFSDAVEVKGPLLVGGPISTQGALDVPKGLLTFGTGIILQDYDGNLHLSSPRPSLRLFSTEMRNVPVSLELFSLGKTFADVNHECLQISAKDKDAYVFTTRKGGLGTNRSIHLQTQGNARQLSLLPDGTVNLGRKIEGGYGVNIVGGFQASSSSHIQGDLVVEGRVYSNADKPENRKPSVFIEMDPLSDTFSIKNQAYTRSQNGLVQLFVVLRRNTGEIGSTCTLTVSGLPYWTSESDIMVVNASGPVIPIIGTNKVEVEVGEMDMETNLQTLHWIIKDVDYR